MRIVGNQTRGMPLLASVQEFFRGRECLSRKPTLFHQAMQRVPDQLVIIDNCNELWFLFSGRVA